MKFKKILSLTLASTLLLSTNIYADSNEMIKSTYQYSSKEKITQNSITNPELLNKIILEDNLEVPEGYELVEVITTTVENVPSDSNNIEFNNTEEDLQKLFAKWTLKNITSKEEQGKLITSDYYDGPSNFTHSYEETVSCSYSTKSGISVKALSAELGFSVTGTEKVGRTYNVNVDKGKKVNLKVYVNNKKYSFSVYKNDDYKGSGTATKPIGLIFKQYVFNK